MKKFVLLGSILEMILPFAIITWKVENTTIFSGNYSLLYYNSEDLFSNYQGSIMADWFTSSGVYHDYFGKYWFFGIIVLILILISFIFSLIDTKPKRSENLLLISGIILLLLRFLYLSDNDLSFFVSRDNIVRLTYQEIPLAPITAIVLSIVELIKSK